MQEALIQTFPNSISPDEAIVIRSIRRASSIPYVSVRLYEKGRSAWIELQPMVLNLSCSADLTYPNNVPAYISNLEGLGVLDIQDMFSIDKDELYAPIEDIARKTHSDIPENLRDREIKFDRGKIDITSFGRLFLHACFPSQ